MGYLRRLALRFIEFFWLSIDLVLAERLVVEDDENGSSSSVLARVREQRERATHVVGPHTERLIPARSVARKSIGRCHLLSLKAVARSY
jgi:hypothetical protein